MLRRALTIIAVLLLLALTWLGISGGITQWSDTVSSSQRVQLATQVWYGAFALLTVVTAFKWPQWQKLAERGFLVGAVAAASLATMVWGEASLLAGVLSGIGALLVAGLIVWMLRVGRRA